MTRVKSVASRKHVQFKKDTKGFVAARRRRTKAGKEALLHAGQYAYMGRKNRKRDFRKIWITRLSIAAKENGTSYSKLIGLLKKSKVEIDRKILSEIALSDPKSFSKILENLK